MRTPMRFAATAAASCLASLAFAAGPQSVEGKPEVRAITGAQGSGVTLGFTIMSNEGQDTAVNAAMGILTGARN